MFWPHWPWVICAGNQHYKGVTRAGPLNFIKKFKMINFALTCTVWDTLCTQMSQKLLWRPHLQAQLYKVSIILIHISKVMKLFFFQAIAYFKVSTLYTSPTIYSNRTITTCLKLWRCVNTTEQGSLGLFLEAQEITVNNKLLMFSLLLGYQPNQVVYR